MIALMPLLTLIAALGSGLMAGLFFAFSSFIMTALAKLPPEQGIAAMNSINVTILNATFGLAFFGTALLCVGLGIASVLRWAEPGSAWLLAGSLLYLAGVIIVTMAFNVPLNDALAAVSPTSPEGTALWTRYLAEWLPWNHVRTFANIGALIAFILAYGRQAALNPAQGASPRLVQSPVLMHTPAQNAKEHPHVPAAAFPRGKARNPARAHQGASTWPVDQQRRRRPERQCHSLPARCSRPRQRARSSPMSPAPIRNGASSRMTAGCSSSFKARRPM